MRIIPSWTLLTHAAIQDWALAAATRVFIVGAAGAATYVRWPPGSMLCTGPPVRRVIGFGEISRGEVGLDGV